MSLHLYDTRARAVRRFEPCNDGVVTVYVCGPTVQAPPHVGHARSAVAFDILRRWLLASGYDVIFARNITDIDDKILAGAAAAEVPWWALAERNTRAFTAAYDALGVMPPTVEPRATGHVPEMVTLMQRLIDDGHAYAAGGSVYFSVRSYDGYGALSGQRVDNMQPSEHHPADPDEKRDSLDFALWKAAKPGEPTWATPWPGPARLAPRVLGDGDEVPRPTSTSTAAASTWSSRTTRTRWRSPVPPATASPATGCTTAWSTPAGRR